MNIEEIKNEYDLVKKSGDNIAEILKFKKNLLSNNSDEVRNFHYELLREHKNKKLYQHIRAAFIKRTNIEEFLIERLNSEKDDNMQADILHILGRIRSAHAVKIAHDFLKHENEYHREVASYVLGWVGNKDDIKLLNYQMLNEKSPWLRITAASAHRQIASRMPEYKMELIRSLKQGFELEQNDEVVPWIIIMIETILITRLGIREDKDDPYIWHGDLEKAKIKTKQLLETI
ncbi:MAG: HEAT repeat domain-containing protein [Verrucomicrobia bacterium]|nr:HEAT repeat domain-containing protein [Deltaproteobacteria bacterium]